MSVTDPFQIEMLNKNYLKEVQTNLEIMNSNKIFLQVKQEPKETVQFYDIPINIDLQKYTYILCKQKGLPYELALAVMKTESEFNPKCIHRNKNGSIDKGIMQINSCHADVCKQLGITDLLNPYQNIKVGVELLSNIYKQYPTVHKMCMVYNMGKCGAVSNWKVGRGTTEYSRKVVKNINIIKLSK
jgi:soluble lytic murein transglycosylase-like protein